ncbi:unnamed protein product, partial [Closterium sp. Naga37s-1]
MLESIEMSLAFFPISLASLHRPFSPFAHIAVTLESTEMSLAFLPISHASESHIPPSSLIPPRPRSDRCQASRQLASLR